MSAATDLHEALLDALRTHQAAEHRLATLLFRMQQDNHFLELGYCSLGNYAKQALDLETRKTRALLQLGRALPHFPVLDQAFAAGTLGWTKAREVLRVATEETEAAWVAKAQQITSRELEAMVSMARCGETPTDEPPEERGPARRRAVFEMESLDLETLRAAIAWYRTEMGAGTEVEDGVILAAMAQRMLHDAEGEAAPTGEVYRKVIQICPRCDQDHGYDAEVTDTLRAEADCDAEVLDMREGPRKGHVSRTIPPALRRTVLHRDRGRCIVPGCESRLWLHLHHSVPFRVHPHHDVDLLCTVCTGHHRQTHEGRLGIGREGDDFVVRWPDGRVRRVRRPRQRERPAHVGRGASTEGGARAPSPHGGKGTTRPGGTASPGG